MTQRFLVTGGAGYVGSHLVAALLDRGDEVTVLDNLRTGHRAAVPAGARVVVGDLADRETIDTVLGGATLGDATLGDATLAKATLGDPNLGDARPGDGVWDGVFHFASLSQVGESMRMPMRYLLENAANGIRLIDACVRHGVERFVLSSTAALFNLDSDVPIPEDAPIDPQSAYGDSKWMIERALRWAGQVHGLRFACLRYFNAAGADPAGRLGEDHRPETHLVPLVIDAALGRRAELDVFGDDYPTPDGTCIRDYVHVSDLASAHLLAVEALDQGSTVWNLGNSAGHSVKQVIASVERVSGLKVPYRVVGRRPGDAAVLVAASSRARQAGWLPRYGRLDDIVRTAFAWRKSHPDGYGD
jgi:UDP-glucose 4-epimerase